MHKFLATLLLLLLPLHAIGADRTAREAGTITLLVENDAFAATDHHLEPLLRIQKERRVTDVQAGFVLARGDFRAAYAFIHRSREFDRQLKPHRFGSLAFTWRF